MYQEICEKIKASAKIIIHRHKNPDGDAIGSQIGLKEAIKSTYPHKKVLLAGTSNHHFTFLGTMDEISDDDYQDALVIILDTSTSDIIDDERYQLGKYVIKIDHHKSGFPYGDLNLVLDEKISTSLIIAEMIFTEKMKLTQAGAMALFTGIVTDSGRFRYHGVDANTFQVAGKLLDYGFSLDDVYQNLYLESLDIVRFRAQMTLKFKVEGPIAYLKTTYQEVLDSGYDIFTISRGMVGIMGGIIGIDIWANFTEKENGEVLAELRSSKYDVGSIASAFGGGGHKLASGATLASFAEADKLIKALHNLVEKNYE